MNPVLSALFALALGVGVAHGEVRTFSSADGSYSVRATLRDVETNKAGARVAVLLRHPDGVTVRVGLDRLSAADVKFITDAGEMLSVPATMRGRLSPESRAAHRRQCGSDAVAGEAAVENTLKWLSSRQNPDGSWGETHPAAMTGMALLTFAGHGHGPGSREYGALITRGIEGLVAIGRKNHAPFFGVLSTTPGVTKSTYGHGIATQALAEMYALSQRGKKGPAELGPAVTRAEGIIILKQNANGAWGYKDGIGYDPYGGNDLSVTGWQIHALYACRESGIQNEKRPVALKKATAYLISKQTADGGFGNSDRTAHYNQWCLTGSALSGLQAGTRGFQIAPPSAVEKRGTDWLVKLVKSEPLQWQKDCYLYTWYYNGLALHHAGGDAWKTWNEQCEKLLLNNQNPDGSWKVEGVGEIGAAGSGGAFKDKDLYRACLAALILETPCRFSRPHTVK